MKLPDDALCASGFVTVTLTAAAACAGETAVMLLALTTFTFVAAVAPNLTVAPLAKLPPLIVTVVPPVVGPDDGEKFVIVGAGTASTVIDPIMLECPLPQSLWEQTNAYVPGAVGVKVTLFVDPRGIRIPDSTHVSMMKPWPTLDGSVDGTLMFSVTTSPTFTVKELGVKVNCFAVMLNAFAESGDGMKSLTTGAGAFATGA